MKLNIPIEAIIGTNYVKVNVLSSEIARAFAGSTASHLNIYIDMYPMISSLYNEDLHLDINDYLSITSCILNMCVHYREYFRRSLGVETTIFIVMSYNLPEMNLKLVSGYNYKMYVRKNNVISSMISEMVNTNVDVLSTLCPYLPDVHFIKTEYESSVVIANIINKEKLKGNMSPSLVISKDAYPMQLLPVYNDVALLRPKKVRGEDLSYIVGPLDMNNVESIMQFWNVFSMLREVKQNDYGISPINFSLLLSLVGLRERNMKTLLNIASAKRFISNSVGTMNVPCSIQSLFDVNRDLEEKLSRMEVDSRFKALDITFQESIYAGTVESKLMSYDNRQDPVAVKAINDKYFSKNPIDLDKL